MEVLPRLISCTHWKLPTSLSLTQPSFGSFKHHYTLTVCSLLLIRKLIFHAWICHFYMLNSYYLFRCDSISTRHHRWSQTDMGRWCFLKLMEIEVSQTEYGSLMLFEIDRNWSVTGRIWVVDAFWCHAFWCDAPFQNLLKTSLHL